MKAYWLTTDPTAHAEVNCIRAAATALKTIFLRGCTLYSTTEPCPMCLSAIHWAKIERVVFGATIAGLLFAGLLPVPSCGSRPSPPAHAPPPTRRFPIEHRGR